MRKQIKNAIEIVLNFLIYGCGSLVLAVLIFHGFSAIVDRLPKWPTEGGSIIPTLVFVLALTEAITLTWVWVGNNISGFDTKSQAQERKSEVA